MEVCKSWLARFVLAVSMLSFLSGSNSLSARVEVDAIEGTPFGVARVSFHRRDLRRPFQEQYLYVDEEAGRALYPAFRYGRFGAKLGELIGLGDGSPDTVTISFLFTGREPLRLKIYTPDALTLEVTPRSAPREYGRSLDRWWNDYHTTIREQRREGDYPPWVQTYLVAMLGSRLRLESPLLARDISTPPSQTQEILELLAGTERLSEVVLKESMTQPAPNEEPQFPLPVGIEQPSLNVSFPADVQIEPLAKQVPRDWAYVRFGRFNNFLWLNRLLEEYGGDMGRLVTTRGFSHPLNERLQTQLVLKQDLLAEMLGESVIADVALVGRDFFMQEGPAIGILFHAKQSAILSRDLTGKRKAVFDREKASGATLEAIKIGNNEVTFLSTPDNRLRSFYAQRGDFHLVTTSRAMAEQFLDLADNGFSLGDEPEFKHARGELPLERQDTAFVYLSSHFLRGLLSPRYQVELRRRLESVVDMRNVQLAQWAARAEHQPASTIDELIAGGFLPPGFGRRPDGSGLVLTDDRAIDSRRGAMGSFLPIPDVDVVRITSVENARCQKQLEQSFVNWKQVDPLYIAIRRYKLNEQGLERISVQANVSPFEQAKYGWLTSMLGPPMSQRISSAAGDVIQVQAFLNGGMFDPQVGPHHLFLGVQDHVPLADLGSGNLFKTLQLLKATPGYLGAWPNTGFLDRLPLGLGGGRPDAFGYSRLPLGLWRRQGDGFSVVSFDPNLLAHVTPQLAVEQVDDVAQVRVHVGNLAETRVKSLVNGLYFDQARRTSLGNARFVQMLSQQFHVPPANALATAEKLLDAQLVCSLGGDYQLQQPAGGAQYWASTAWNVRGDTTPPADYQAPLLVWFRGLDAGLIKQEDRLQARVTFDMQRAKAEMEGIDLPLFDWFSAPRVRDDDAALPPPLKTEGMKLFPASPAPQSTAPGRDF